MSEAITPSSPLGKRQEQFSRQVVNLLQFAFKQGFDARLGECQRTIEQQELYVKQGKSKTMASKHIDKLAIDIHFFKDGAWIQDPKVLEPIGKYWETLGIDYQAGMFWKDFLDVPHFQGA